MSKNDEVFGEMFMPKSIPIFGSENEKAFYDPDELIDLFLNSTADGFAIVDMEYRYVRINHMYTRIFGYTEKDVIGRSLGEFPNTNHILNILAQVKTGMTFTNLITPRYHKDGALLDISVSYSPLRNAAGEIIGVMGIFRDITKFVNMERELNRTRELYKLIAENTTDMIKIYTKDKKIVYASPSHEKGIGIPAEELIGKSVYDIISPDETESLNKSWHELMKQNNRS
jgi:two-component system sporulation sensor kinase A